MTTLVRGHNLNNRPKSVGLQKSKNETLHIRHNKTREDTTNITMLRGCLEKICGGKIRMHLNNHNNKCNKVVIEVTNNINHNKHRAKATITFLRIKGMKS